MKETKVNCPISNNVYIEHGWLNKCPLKFSHPSTCQVCKEEKRYNDKWWIENSKS